MPRQRRLKPLGQQRHQHAQQQTRRQGRQEEQDAVIKKAFDRHGIEYVLLTCHFEKANSLKPDDVDTMRNLKELYFRLRTVKPDYEAKYNEIMKK